MRKQNLTLTDEKLSAYLRASSLQLFFSVDLVGSTAYKTKNPRTWIGLFEQFYREFPTHLRAEGVPDQFKPVKFLGDEIVFMVEIRQSAMVQHLLQAARKAVFTYNAALEQHNTGLQCKGCAWIAGFPLSNRFIKIASAKSEVTDFIGPDIDIGFKLARVATTRKFILSTKLAWMLAEVLKPGGLSSQRVYFEGEQDVPGLPGIYPVFWLDVMDEPPRTERMREGERPRAMWNDIADHCREFELSRKKNPQVFCPLDMEGPFTPFLKRPSSATRPKVAEVHGFVRDYAREYWAHHVNSDSVPTK